jgi:pimeloyl-ACP methyl ester carboxylesterase
MAAVTEPASAGVRERARRMEIHTVEGGGGLRLHVREWGKADGPPILFLHGLSQNHLCWTRQYDSRLADEFRLIAFDLRGHGMSDMPLGAEHYTEGRLWAEDLAAIIDTLDLDRPVLVGWSYGPLVILDYIRIFGQERVAAVNFVGGAVTLGQAAFGGLIGPGFLDHFAAITADDLPTNIRAMRAFLDVMPAKPLARDDYETALAGAMVVPPRIRANLAAREIDGDDALRVLTVPVLVTHGRRDSVVLPAMVERVLATCTTAQASWYDSVGHLPFLEAPERFNRELADLTRAARR